jgi:hypothetical protein
MSTEVTNLYRVKVVVELDYEVEATSEAEAEEQGWNWEDYRGFSEVNTIEVSLEKEDVFNELEEEEA